MVEDGDTPVRVLHVSQPNAGGVAVYIGQAVREQRARGWEVAVACPPGGDLPARCAAAGVPWFSWKAGRAPGPRILLESLSLRRLVKGFEPDVVHLHSSKAGLAGRLPGRPRGTPTIFQPHGWSWLAATGAQDALSRWWERVAARWSDALVCVGLGELREGVRAGVRGPFRIVRNGVDRRLFRPADAAARLVARTRLGLPATAPLAVCVGRLTRQKGQDVLVAAWPAVVARCPTARLAIVGDGADLDRLRRAPAAGGVLFAPASREPADWLSASDVVVLPSRWEGLSLIALEALAVGRPLVGSDVPGIAEVVRPGVGALVPADDPGALAAAVAHRLLRPAVAEREGEAAAAASAGYDLGRTLALLASVTREVAALRDHRPCDRCSDDPCFGERCLDDRFFDGVALDGDLLDCDLLDCDLLDAGAPDGGALETGAAAGPAPNSSR
ncbi:glycosyltransferase family 4 protein [Actinomadura decatromicini]|uniref:Glycosyltransferase family 4 protein n=1 Tax=Actinomadura decatromicini TaxID=2604572 RepID=A0A5D3FTA9_9ACTN|nr:glycosyltransferase family 4 protein [Actinomadura decatromicini]